MFQVKLDPGSREFKRDIVTGSLAYLACKASLLVEDTKSEVGLKKRRAWEECGLSVASAFLLLLSSFLPHIFVLRFVIACASIG